MRDPWGLAVRLVDGGGAGVFAGESEVGLASVGLAEFLKDLSLGPEDAAGDLAVTEVEACGVSLAFHFLVPF